MNSVVRPIRGVGALPAVGAEPTNQHSRLLPSLFENLDTSRLVSVLDAGPAISETVRFFGQFRCRMHIANLYSEPLVRDQQDDLTEQEMKAAFRDALNFQVGTLVDVCLFWDFLNYLSRPALRAFSAALAPYIHSGTRGHGFSVLSVETPLRNQQYGVVEPEVLSVRQSTQAQLDYYPHSHEELNESFNCFRIQRGWLLPDGRLEIALNAQV